MKILHTADWHLGKKLGRFPRLDEQRDCLEELCMIAETHNVDAVLVAGDLFDVPNPPTEALDLLYKTLKRLAANGKRAVVAIAGNHDSADYIDAPIPLAKECGILLIGRPGSQLPPFSLAAGIALTRSDKGFAELVLPGHSFPLRLVLAPYANEARLKRFLGNDKPEETLRTVLKEQWHSLADTYCDTAGVNMLVAHLLFMKRGGPVPEEPQDERHIALVGGAEPVFAEDIPPQVQYTALGHLHRNHSVPGHQAPVAYSGSLLEYSFAEANQQKFVNLVHIVPGQPAKIDKIALKSGKKLLRKSFDDIEEALVWLRNNQDAFVELTLVTDGYIDEKTKMAITEAHNSVTAIIPKFSESHGDPENRQWADLTQNTELLFAKFFEDKHGQAPTDTLLSLFREVYNSTGHGEGGNID